jgi:type II secretory pathway component PulM
MPVNLQATLERQEWWQRRSPRERTLLALCVAIVAFAVIALAVVAPLTDLLIHAPQAHAERKALLERAAAQVATIERAVPGAPAVDARAAIERALDARRIARNAATIDVAQDRIALTLPAARLEDVAALVDGLRRDGLRLVEATLAARADADGMRAELAFAPSGP